MHPEGDELLLICFGALNLQLKEQDGINTVGLSTQTAFIVLAGIWHRLLLREPSTLIAITHRPGTLYKKVDDL